ncbi:hypothetical protein GCM10027294_44020 [Marinactinospora endophytica]
MPRPGGALGLCDGDFPVGEEGDAGCLPHLHPGRPAPAPPLRAHAPGLRSGEAEQEIRTARGCRGRSDAPAAWAAPAWRRRGGPRPSTLGAGTQAPVSGARSASAIQV